MSAEIAAHLAVPATAEAFAALDPDVVTAAQTAVAPGHPGRPRPAALGRDRAQRRAGHHEPLPRHRRRPRARRPAGPHRRRGRRRHAPAHRHDARGVPALPRAHRRRRRGDRGGLAAVGVPLRLAGRQAVETYAANRPGASPGDVACAILTDAGFRVPAHRLADRPATTRAAPSMPTSSGGRRRSPAWVPATRSSSPSCSTPWAPAHPWQVTLPRSSSPTQMHHAWVAFARDGTPGWRALDTARTPPS